MSLEARGDENPYDMDTDRLIDAGWLTDEQGEALYSAARAWIRSRTTCDETPSDRLPPLGELRSAEDALQAAFFEVFGEQFMRTHPVAPQPPQEGSPQ